jgi:sensor histidine kinase YesM
VRHGISARSASGIVEVSAEIAQEKLLLTVRDDGPGIHAATAQPGSGTGLSNTRERLVQLYGAAARMTIEDAREGGTVVSLMIPRSGRGTQADGVVEPETVVAPPAGIAP